MALHWDGGAIAVTPVWQTPSPHVVEMPTSTFDTAKVPFCCTAMSTVPPSALLSSVGGFGGALEAAPDPSLAAVDVEPVLRSTVTCSHRQTAE